MMNIKADRDYMTTILDRIKNGRIMIPKFQRDFVWNTGQMLDLLDSILKGFPIGSLILWTPEQERFMTINNIEGVEVDTSKATGKQDDVCYILDGRQRVTVLLASLFEEGDFSKDFYVNLDDMRPFRQSNQKRERFYNLSLSEAFDTYSLVGYLERLKSSDLPEVVKLKYADRAKYVNKILQSYELGYINVKGGTIDEAVEIFSRLNSKATIISKDYMIQALAYNTDSDFLFGQAITNIKSGLAEYNFADISRDLIFKCVFNHTDKIFIDGQIQNILDIKEQLPRIMVEVNENIRKAVDFLYMRCGVVDSKILPYSYHLVILADFFRIVPEPTEEQLWELKRWFFYTTYTNYFTNTSLARIRNDISRFRRFAEGAETLPLDDYEAVKITPFPEKYSLRSVRVCSIVAVSMLHIGVDKNLGSVFESIMVPVEGMVSRNCSNTIVCSSKAEVVNLTQLFKGEIAWNRDFEKFCLSEEMFRAYCDKDFSGFVKKRNEVLQTMEISFLSSINLEVV